MNNTLKLLIEEQKKNLKIRYDDIDKNEEHIKELEEIISILECGVQTQCEHFYTNNLISYFQVSRIINCIKCGLIKAI